MKRDLILSTRQSPLALAQVEITREKILENPYFQGQIKIHSQLTQGDKDLSSPLFHKGGKGLFVREIEQSLLDGNADIAVHSLKDLPLTNHDQLELAGFLSEYDCEDVIISCEKNLPLDQNAVVGTSSLRRASQLKIHYPDIQIQPIRGSVGRRIEKLKNENFTHTLLALAGLNRLKIQLANPCRTLCPKKEMIPAFSQGIIALQIRRSDKQLKDFLKTLSCPQAQRRQFYERLIAQWFQATCQSAFGCYVLLSEQEGLNQAFIFAYQSQECWQREHIYFKDQNDLKRQVFEIFSLGSTSWALCQEQFFSLT